MPIEDTEVHPWTAVIDNLLSDGATLMTVAVGNNGARDKASGNARVQVPSDAVLHGETRMRGSSLNDPSFDIHYNAREMGAGATKAKPIPYALVITLEAGRHPQLYNEILRSYAQILSPIQPKVPLNITV